MGIAPRDEAVVAAHLVGVILVPENHGEVGEEGGIGILKVGEVPVQKHPLLKRVSDTIRLAEGLEGSAKGDIDGLELVGDGLAELADLVEELVKGGLDAGVDDRIDWAAIREVEGALIADFVEGEAKLAGEDAEGVAIDAGEDAAAKVGGGDGGTVERLHLAGEDAATGAVAALEDGDLESLGEELAGGGEAGEASANDDDGGRGEGGGAARGGG